MNHVETYKIIFQKGTPEYKLFKLFSKSIFYIEGANTGVIKHLIDSNNGWLFFDHVEQNGYIFINLTSRFYNLDFNKEIARYAYPSLDLDDVSLSYEELIAALQSLLHISNKNSSCLILIDENNNYNDDVITILVHTDKPIIDLSFISLRYKVEKDLIQWSNYFIPKQKSRFNDYIYYDESIGLSWSEEEEKRDPLFIDSIFLKEKTGKKKINKDYPTNSPEAYELDKTTEQLVDEIESKIQQLDKSQLIHLIPLLKKKLSNTAKSIKSTDLMSIKIDERHQVFVYPAKLKVELNALTKAIYLFFVIQDSPIDLDDLPKYKNDIFEIYKQVSNLADLNQMKQSVEALVDPYSNAIFTHISRIKKAFYSIMDKEFVEDFIITGTGRKNRFVRIDKTKVTLIRN